ncbi:unnamed protein product [Nesidiocoris tenuis]|uniref:Uncharacterized protein n=1 Tax=Nesidiocoris tenuis TaxID=355587 RepID=A0A6H5HG58_9HEMI|nr:unnamed protein product [Nesidiocoris tenuis]
MAEGPEETGSSRSSGAGLRMKKVKGPGQHLDPGRSFYQTSSSHNKRKQTGKESYHPDTQCKKKTGMKIYHDTSGKQVVDGRRELFRNPQNENLDNIPSLYYEHNRTETHRGPPSVVH